MPDDRAKRYLIDPILPKHEISLLGGPSGAGKTRWLLDTLLQWEEGHDILGCPSYPVPWAYVSADRSLDSLERTLNDMNIPPKRIPLIPAWDLGLKWHEVLDRVEATKAQLVVIEAFGSFVEPPANSRMVKDFLNTTARLIRRTGKTVIGVVESPKMKPHDRYENPRQRISGAAAWGHFSETIFLIEPLKSTDPGSPERVLYMCPRNGAGKVLGLTFDLQGHLIVNLLGERPKSGDLSM